VHCKLKRELLSNEIRFCRSAARTSKISGVRNQVIREKMGITKTILERMENNMLKWYGRAMQMADNTWLSEY
jgi:hypothetical protein